MLGLIKKDLFLIKGNLKLIIIIFVILSFNTIVEENNNLLFLPSFISTVLFMSTFSYDEYNKWNTYAATLPTGRKKIVGAKYIATLLLNILVFLATIIVSLIIAKTSGNINQQETLYTILGTLVAVIILQSIIYPLIFKFGVEKGRIWLFAGIFGITTVLGLIVTKINLTIPSTLISFFNNYYIVLVPLVTIACLFISYKFSEKIYLKKEF